MNTLGRVGQLVILGEHRLTLGGFEKRWQEKRRPEVREAAPPHGLCLIRAGYEEKLFSEAGWFDSLPRYSLAIPDPPADPPDFAPED